jgi:pimeloyl-ACP methyl ester carboxylesterase
MEQYPLFSRYMDGLWQFQACHFLTAEKSAELMVTLPPKQPVLLLAGELDPITPVAWAREQHARWPGSQLLAVEGVGHAVLNSNACIHRHLRLFLDGAADAFAACESNLLTQQQ